MKDDVKFYVRVLDKQPLSRWDASSFKISSDKKTIFVKTLKRVGFGLRSKDLYWQFNTDGVFLPSNQHEIYLELAHIDLPSVLKGADLMIIAFGQINSGKTHTTSAPYEKYAERGVIPRLLSAFFRAEEDMGTYGAEIKLKMSYLEFFHDKCYDLLIREPIQIDHRKIVPTDINSIQDALRKFFQGEVRRKFEGVSNHCGTSVLTLYVESKTTRVRSGNVNYSKIHIVDCPGIESMYSSSKGKSQACSIAASLNKFNFDRAAKWSATLEEVLKSRACLPCPPVFNCSNLISFLGRSLTNGMVRLVGHVTSDRKHAKLTLSTLRFGCKMAKYLFSQVIYNARPELATVAEVLQDEVARLENEAHQNSLIRAGGEYKSNNVFQGEMQHIERLVSQYLTDENLGRMTENILLSTAHPSLVFREIKNKYHKDFEDYLQRQVASLQSTASESTAAEDTRKTLSDTLRDNGFVTNQRKQPTPTSVTSHETSPPSKEMSAVEEPAVSRDGGGGAPSNGGPKRKSVSHSKRKSVARKSKIGPGGKDGRGGGGGGKKKKLIEKTEKSGTPPQFNKKMLEFGLKNKKWFFEEFLKRNAEINQQFSTVNEGLMSARNEKDSTSWTLVQERKNLAEATLGAEEASCKQTGGGGEEDRLVEQEFLAQIEKIKATIIETVGKMVQAHESYLKATAAQAQFMKETAEPKFHVKLVDVKIILSTFTPFTVDQEFIRALEETCEAEVVIQRADAKDLPLFRPDTFRSLRLNNRTDNRTGSEIEFAGFQRKYGAKV